MTWQLWILAGLFLVNIVLAPTQVDKPRDPISPGMAAGMVTLNLVFLALLIWGTV